MELTERIINGCWTSGSERRSLITIPTCTPARCRNQPKALRRKPPAGRTDKKAEANLFTSAFFERLTATYSRGDYKTTTIGKAVFDGRVRNGIGSDHSFMATKKSSLFERALPGAGVL